VHDVTPSACGWRAHEDEEPEKNVDALPLKATVPVGGELEAESWTVAVQVLALPAATSAGRQETVIFVGSISASTATPPGFPEPLMKVGSIIVRPELVSSPRPIVPLLPDKVLAVQYRYVPPIVTDAGNGTATS
jgi:hypothetical protein